MSTITKILSFFGFRVESAWLAQYVKLKFDERQAHYAGMVYLTQAEYDALTEAEKMDTTKLYAIEED